uniref:ceramide transfer protein-like isoform X2 n=1 Tax=Myxine glutinosa TaxID=7769 RepID=UPI00358DE4AB
MSGLLSFTLEEDDEECGDARDAFYAGTLSKWTNYLHGWQDRFVLLRGQVLSYYKSEGEIHIGCRGCIVLQQAFITVCDFDKCRFDVNFSDCVWYLRTQDAESRQAWLTALEQSKVQGDPETQHVLPRHGSTLSLLSSGSLLSATSSNKKFRALREKLADLETFRDIFCRQFDVLQERFDQIGSNDDFTKSPQRTDFRGEAIAFKETITEILETLSYCIELMGKPQEDWQRRLEREGSNGVIKEDEFFDAVDAALDKQDQQYKSGHTSSTRAAALVPSDTLSNTAKHRFTEQLEAVIQKHLELSLQDIGGDAHWEILVEEGEMKVYHREEVKDGVAIDPHKATHVARGVTGHEICLHFWDVNFRPEWEVAMEDFKVLEVLSENTIIVHQTLKRDIVFLSCIYKVPTTAVNTWLVCNVSVDHPDAPANGCIRAQMDVAMICQTTFPQSTGSAVQSRDGILCNLTYVASINPGGWVPASLLRAVARREYPTFLHRFLGYVRERTSRQPVLL